MIIKKFKKFQKHVDDQTFQNIKRLMKNLSNYVFNESYKKYKFLYLSRTFGCNNQMIDDFFNNKKNKIDNVVDKYNQKKKQTVVGSIYFTQYFVNFEIF